MRKNWKSYNKTADMTIESLKDTVLSGHELTIDQARWLAETEDSETLYEAAHEITKSMAETEFDMCSIINAKSGKKTRHSTVLISHKREKTIRGRIGQNM